MKIGTTIHNNDMTLTVVAFYSTDDTNVALLVSENGCGGCHYVAVRDLTREKSGNYFWYHGYYTDDFDSVVTNFNERRKSLGV